MCLFVFFFRVSGDDFIVGKTCVNTPTSEEDQRAKKFTKRDRSAHLRRTEAGTIDQVILTTNEDNKKMTKIKVKFFFHSLFFS